MTRKSPPTNLAASVRARLDDLRKKKGLELELVLSEFAIERLLYRLGTSPYADRFVLKGATLFRIWSEERGRATWDLDLLGRGGSGVEEMAAVLREICIIQVGDGIEFLPDSVNSEEIRIPDEYGGVRVRLEARIAAARIPVQIDIGFGDSVVPPASWVHFPVLLDLPIPSILAYPKETVVAEKFEAMVSKGVTNTRMKDFYDIHRLALTAEFQGELLTQAIRATFARRGNPLPVEVPVALQIGFLAAPERKAAWKAFLRRGRLETSLDTETIMTTIRTFLLPILKDAMEVVPLPRRWQPGGPWALGGEAEKS